MFFEWIEFQYFIYVWAKELVFDILTKNEHLVDKLVVLLEEPQE